jgi:hypothetical protein
VLSEIVTVRPDRNHLYGATDAQSDMEPVRALSKSAGARATLVALDFGAAASVSGSYLRGSILWTALCGKAHAEGAVAPHGTDPWAVRPLPLHPLLIAASSEILGEVDDFLKQRGMVCLATSADPREQPFTTAYVLGRLDCFLMETLTLLARHGPAVAQNLRELSSENISVGGWSNRLAALHAHRLVTRTRNGKSWIYQTLAKEHTLWA